MQPTVDGGWWCARNSEFITKWLVNSMALIYMRFSPNAIKPFDCSSGRSQYCTHFTFNQIELFLFFDSIRALLFGRNPNRRIVNRNKHTFFSIEFKWYWPLENRFVFISFYCFNCRVRCSLFFTEESFYKRMEWNHFNNSKEYHQIAANRMWMVKAERVSQPHLELSTTQLFPFEIALWREHDTAPSLSAFAL